MKTLFPKILLLVLAMSASLLCSAHRHDRRRKEEGPYEGQNIFRIRVVPSNIFNRFAANLPIGLEYCISKKWSLLADVSIPFYTVNDVTGTVNPNYNINRQSRFRGEVRWHFHDIRRARFLIGIEGFKANTGYTEHGGGIEDGKYFSSYTYAEVKKSVTGGGFVWGVEFMPFRNFYISTTVGLGLKYVQLDRENVQKLQQSPYTSNHIFRQENQVGASAMLGYIPFGLSLSYGLGKRR